MSIMYHLRGVYRLRLAFASRPLSTPISAPQNPTGSILKISTLALTSDGLHRRARALTLRHHVQHLILVIQNDELLRTGIPLEWIDVANIVDEDLDSVEAPGQPLTQQALRKLVGLVKHWVKP